MLLVKQRILKIEYYLQFLLLVIYRLGTYVPLAGIDPLSLKEIMASSQKGLLGMFNMFSGGAVTRMAIFALRYYAIYFVINYSSTAYWCF